MGQRTLWEVRVGSKEATRRSRRGRGTLGEVRDGSGDTRGGPGRVGRSTRRSVMGRGNYLEVIDGSGDPQKGLRWVGGPAWRFWTGQGTLGMSGT